MQIPDPAAAQREIDELEAEASTQMPSVLFGETPAGSGQQATPAAAVSEEISASDAATERRSDEGGADQAAAAGEPEAGVTTELTLDGAQITAVIEVLNQYKSGLLSDIAAEELLVAVGMQRASVRKMLPTMAKLPPAPSQGASDNGQVTDREAA